MKTLDAKMICLDRESQTRTNNLDNLEPGTTWNNLENLEPGTFSTNLNNLSNLDQGWSCTRPTLAAPSAAR